VCNLLCTRTALIPGREALIRVNTTDLLKANAGCSPGALTCVHAIASCSEYKASITQSVLTGLRVECREDCVDCLLTASERVLIAWFVPAVAFGGANDITDWAAKSNRGSDRLMKQHTSSLSGLRSSAVMISMIEKLSPSLEL
jgi:hypothetical protein